MKPMIRAAAGAAALLAAACASSAAHPSAPSSPVRLSAACQQGESWQRTYGAFANGSPYSAVLKNRNALAADSGRGDAPAMVDDGLALEGAAANAKIHLPPIDPDDFTAAMNDYIAVGQHIYAGDYVGAAYYSNDAVPFLGQWVETSVVNCTGPGAATYSPSPYGA